MSETPKIILKEGKEKPVLSRHPWVFSGAIQRIDGSPEKGGLVQVLSPKKDFLATGYFNPDSQISVRLLSFDVSEEINEEFFKKRIREAQELRRKWLPPGTDAYRLIHSEGDFIPGLIVDVYAEFLIVQFLTAGIENLKDLIIQSLSQTVPSKGIFEKDDSSARAYEGLPERHAILSGDAPPELIEITENGIKFLVDVHAGQKTGFFLDQRDNRLKVQNHSSGCRVLNCFSYTGGFSLYAAKGGAKEVVSVEASEPALAIAKQIEVLNSVQRCNIVYENTDVFEYLRSAREPFDLIILDPPAFAPTRASVEKAARGYKDINRLALKNLANGGLLFTYSCSHHIDTLLFQKILFSAAKEAGVNVRIVDKTSHAFDHPVNIYHPEGEYLKGFTLLKT